MKKEVSREEVMVNRTTRSIIVKGNIDRIFDLWADVEKFPNFIHQIVQVKKLDDGKSFWRVKGPMGIMVDWYAETTCMQHNKRIAWNSTRGDIKTTGQVTFNELPKGQVEVTATLQCTPKAELGGQLVDSWLDGNNADKDKVVDACLRDFKRYAERHMPQHDHFEYAATAEKTSQGGLAPDEF